MVCLPNPASPGAAQASAGAFAVNPDFSAPELGVNDPVRVLAQLLKCACTTHTLQRGERRLAGDGGYVQCIAKLLMINWADPPSTFTPWPKKHPPPNVIPTLPILSSNASKPARSCWPSTLVHWSEWSLMAIVKLPGATVGTAREIEGPSGLC
jgi:hypothetical protein